MRRQWLVFWQTSNQTEIEKLHRCNPGSRFAFIRFDLASLIGEFHHMWAFLQTLLQNEIVIVIIATS